VLWLAWSHKIAGGLHWSRLQQHFGTLAEAWLANPSALGEVEGLAHRQLSGDSDDALKTNTTHRATPARKANF